MLGVPRTRLAHLPAVLSPILGGVNRTLGVIPGVNALRAKRAFASRSDLFSEQRARYDVAHDMVDSAPRGDGRHPAATGAPE
jgi:hypothetical protein